MHEVTYIVRIYSMAMGWGRAVAKRNEVVEHFVRTKPSAVPTDPNQDRLIVSANLCQRRCEHVAGVAG